MATRRSTTICFFALYFGCFLVSIRGQEEVSFASGKNRLEVTAKSHNITDNTRFLMYDVNPGEGFNLRRDVYIRAANLIARLNNEEGQHWILVLAPWRHLYHWSSRYIPQDGEPWSNFFDVSSMNLYVPVMEFEDFMQVTGSAAIDQIMYLQRHPNGFSGGWKELIEKAECTEQVPYNKDGDKWRSHFWGRGDVYGKQFDCISVQGHATILSDTLKKSKAKSFFIERFEQVLHVMYGDIEFYKARRSLVFAQHLREVADEFRAKNLDSTDEKDKTSYTADWRKQTPKEGDAIGGPYIALHMRRGDFAHYAHKETVASIEELGKEVAKKLKEYKLKKVYLATDGTDDEVKELQSYFKAKIYRFPRSKDEVQVYRDGGIAIIDQWIASHARYFIGTCSSTFSFRIYEERDILGFQGKTTFNCLCRKGTPEDRCERPGGWRVKFG